jgi:hypothetical protein
VCAILFDKSDLRKLLIAGTEGEITKLGGNQQWKFNCMRRVGTALMASFLSNTEVEELKETLNRIHIDTFAVATFKLYKEKILGLVPPLFATSSSRLLPLQESVRRVEMEIREHLVSLEDIDSDAKLNGQIDVFNTALGRLNQIRVR